MRARFNGWGVELDDETFARAVAGRLFELGFRETKNGWAWRWTRGGWRDVRRRWTDSPRRPEELAEAWRRLDDSHSALRVIVPDVERAAAEDVGFAFEVFRWLNRAAPAVKSIVAGLVDEAERVREWGWPLRVGILPGRVAANVSKSTGFEYFLDVREAKPGGGPWDILVVAANLGEALAIFSGAQRSTRARSVLVAGSADSVPIAALGATLAALRTLLQAHATAVLPPQREHKPADELAWLLNSVFWNLAHDHTFEDALFRAARERGAAAPLISADPRFLASTRPSRRLDRLTQKMEAAAPAIEDMAIDLGQLPGFEAVAAAEPTPGGVRELARTIRRNADRVDWEMEAHGATGTAELARRVSAALEPAARASELRYLHAGAREASDNEGPWGDFLVSGRTYAVWVWIGALDRKALVLEAHGLAEPFPKLPNEQDTHELQVVVSDPNLLADPLIDTLLLPPVGESTRCRFLLHCRPGVTRIEARIAVLHRGRVLQTGILNGAIAAEGKRPKKGEWLRFDLDAVPRRRLAGLGGRSEFGAAIVANHTESAGEQRLAVVGNRVGRIKLNDSTLQDLTDCFNQALSDIASEPEEFENLRDEGNLKLLRLLALHGANLHRNIVENNVIGPTLASEPRLQIVTARVDGFIPLELAYRFEAPEKPVLCPGAEEALSAQSGNGGTCAASCGPEPGGTENRICPMGFWCLWKTIERFAHRKEHIDQDCDYGLYAEPIGQRPTLRTLKAGVVAASDKAEKHDPKVVSRVVNSMKEIHMRVGQATNWDQWTAEIAAAHPGMLVLIPHHTRDSGMSALEIGPGNRLASPLVKDKHVVGKPPQQPPGTPVVLLLGCETQDAVVALERFPAAFQSHGAAIVVGTIATVLGRHAGPAAEELVRALSSSTAGERSFGDILVEVRRKLLLKGRAIGLALTGFGDADWLLPKGDAT